MTKTLIEQLVQGRVVPFVGSGVSLAVKPDLFPTWKQLLGHLATKLESVGKDDAAVIVERYVKKGQLDKAAAEAFDELGPAHFRDVMKARFDIDQPADADLALSQAIWALRPPRIVTTNYDRVLAWSNPAADVVLNSQQGNLADLFSKSTSEKPVVWHLHGHIDDPDSLILAPRQYDELYRHAADDKHPLAAARLQWRTLIGNHPLLCIGFGMQDDDVMDALATVLEIFGGSLRPSYALLKTGDDRARTLWKKYNIQVLEFSDYGRPLVQALEQIATGMKTTPAVAGTDAGPAVIPPTYRDWLTNECADIKPLGMEQTQGQSVCLQQVYVPPLTSRRFDEEWLEALQSRRGPARQLAPGEPTDPAESTRPQLVLDLLGQRSLYVSGDAGSGKSTFCRWVAWLSATGEMPPFTVAAAEAFQEHLPDSLRGRLPLLVKLREFAPYLPAEAGRRSLTAAEFQRALQSWLDKTRPGGLCWSDVAPHLRGSLLLILDGVDEMPSGQGDGAAAWSPRESLLDGLAHAARDWLKLGNRLLITSRPYGLEPDQVRKLERAGIAEVRLDPLPDALQDLLATRWFVALPKKSAEGQLVDGRRTADEMLQQVRNLPGETATMAASPLLLTAICIIYGEDKKLPADRHDLYHRIVNTVLSSRYPRNVQQVGLVRGRLAAVALGMHTGELAEPGRAAPIREVHERELDRILADYIHANPETESDFAKVLDCREELLNYSGLLSSSQPQHAAFSHWSFQEFLVAERLMLDCLESEDQLLDRFCRWSSLAGWRPTLAFLFDRRVAHPGWQAGVSLLEKILAAIDPNRLAEQLGLALSAGDALHILLARGLKLQPPLLESFRRLALAAIEQQVELKPRVELALALGRIGDPRVPGDLADPNAWVTVPADTYFLGDDKRPYRIDQPFQISKYPVTNAQYGKFIAAGGYVNDDFWKSDAGRQWRIKFKITEPGYWRDPQWNGPTQPVVGVSWWEAEAFCNWLNATVGRTPTSVDNSTPPRPARRPDPRQAGRTPTSVDNSTPPPAHQNARTDEGVHPTFRLPTEREWEAAARGPEGRVYPWGDDWQKDFCNSREAGLEVTTPVGIFPGSASFCGAHDLAGNVWEWCSDPYNPSEAGNPNIGRVLRGGSWLDRSGSCRAAIRLDGPPGRRGNIVGFRVART